MVLPSTCEAAPWSTCEATPCEVVFDGKEKENGKPALQLEEYSPSTSAFGSSCGSGPFASAAVAAAAFAALAVADPVRHDE